MHSAIDPEILFETILFILCLAGAVATLMWLESLRDTARWKTGNSGWILKRYASESRFPKGQWVSYVKIDTQKSGAYCAVMNRSLVIVFRQRALPVLCIPLKDLLPLTRVKYCFASNPEIKLKVKNGRFAQHLHLSVTGQPK